MSIKHFQDYEMSEKGKKDAERHREKIDSVIRGQIKDIISEESIITKRKDGKVKIPIRGLKDYRFIYGSNDENAGGVGQGDGDAGDVLGRKKANTDNKPGDQLGEDYIETEVDIEKIINLMFEDLGLPYIKEKQSAVMLVPNGWKFETIAKSGIQSQIHKKKTLKETMLRTSLYIKEIMDETDCSYDEASQSLIQAKGDLEEGINIIKEGILDTSINPDQFFIEDDDLRYKKPEEKVENVSNCVILAMIDTSGSMDTNKKYLVRSLLFWINEFLKKTYDNVVIRFIVHTTEARFVDEDTFFKKGESGGTFCHTAFDLANYTLDIEYPEHLWNRYVIYCSDGEDFNTNETINSTKEMLSKNINMLAYCEVDIDRQYYKTHTLLNDYLDHLNFKISTEGGNNFYIDEKRHFLICKIQDKSHIYPAIKYLLFKRD